MEMAKKAGEPRLSHANRSLRPPAPSRHDLAQLPYRLGRLAFTEASDQCVRVHRGEFT